MIVHTGAIVEVSSPACSRRSRPRSTASATASDWGTVKQTVALIDAPAAVSSSTAAMPAAVAGTLICMLGASEAKCSPCSVSRCVSR